MNIDTMCNENFHYKDGVLYIDGVSCNSILENYLGPVVVFSENRIRSNAKSIIDAFLSNYDNCKFYFAYKACYIPKIQKIIQNCGFNGEVTSSFECKMALKNNEKNIIWNSPGKSEEEIKLAIDNQIMMNIDSIYEATIVNEYAKKIEKNIKVGVRLCFDVNISSNIGRNGKLGVDVASGQAFDLCNFINNSTNLQLVGIHSHMSVENRTPDNHVDVLRKLVDFANSLYNKLKITLEYISPGGGFAARNTIENSGQNISTFAKRMCEVMGDLNYKTILIIEPGRYIVDDAAINIGKILCQKQCNQTTWWISDISTNYLVSFAGREFPVYPIILNGRDKICVSIGDRMSSFTGVICRNVEIQNQDVNNFIAASNPSFKYCLALLI